MRRMLIGASVGAMLVIGVTAERGASEAALGGLAPLTTASPLQSSELISHVTAAADGQPITVTVIDPRQRVMSIYHVDRATGEIALRSVRNLTWDLQLIEFNSGKPLPQDIRSGLGR
jgi:hypothetical protein